MDKKFNICGIDFRVSNIDTETIGLFSTGDRDDFYQLTCFINKTNCKWEALVIKENHFGRCVGRSPEHVLCKALSAARKHQMKDKFYIEIDNSGEVFVHPGDSQEIDYYLRGTSDGNWFEFTLDSPYVSLFIDGMEFTYRPASDTWENANLPGISISYSYEKDLDCCYKHKNQRYTVTDTRTKSGEATVYKNVLPENVTRVIDGLFDKVNNLPFW